MSLSGLLGSYPGMYVTQSVFHIVICAVVIDRAIKVWEIDNPRITQRFRFLAILFPIFAFPFYQLVNPQRGSLFFRQEALFDSSRWLYLSLWGTVPLGIFFLFALFFTAVIFLGQELLPVVRHTLESRRDETGPGSFHDNSAVVRALDGLPGEKPEILVLEDDENIIFSTTGRKAAVYVSSGLVQTLSAEQLRAAVAHEMAHIERSRRPMLFVVFLLRMVQFFNPVALLEFRRATQDEEKICDDMAVSLTGEPRVLAGTLRKLYGSGEGSGVPQVAQLAGLRDSLEDYSHSIHIQSRIERLEGEAASKGGGEWFKFSLALVTVSIINYFVV